jgi:hydroxyacylglutathione hydrolase
VYFRQFVLEGLGHASYLVGDEGSARALLVDPRRDVGGYLAAARAAGLRIALVLDTHGHNDYLSGVTEVLARTGADALGPRDAVLGYPHRPLADGEVVEVGDLGVQVLHTPGHTPEHLALALHDRAAGPDPLLLLSGGALLVGSVGRPDLLGGPEQAAAGAVELHRTLHQRLAGLPDHLPVYPTHVAGSLCGSAIGRRLVTTLGHERATSDAFREGDPDRFAADLLDPARLPAVPPYWRRMRAQNLAGPAPLGVLPEPPAMTPAELEAAARDGGVVVDARSAEAFTGGHVPGALFVGLGSSFETWAGTVVDPERPSLLVLDRPADLEAARWGLLRIGLSAPAGWLAGGMAAWRSSGRPVATLPTVDVGELRRRLDDGTIELLDVRQPAEWADGHVEGARFLTGALVPDRLAELPRDRPLAVICDSGHRSTVIAGLLAREGFRTAGVTGGMSAWRRSGRA